MSDEFRTIIVAAPIVEQVRALAAAFPGGVGMFTTPCLTGDEITHYLSTGMAPAWVIDNLPCGDNPGNLEQLAQLINDAGGSTSEAELTALLAYVDISTEEWPVALERLGLTLGSIE
jgi:hypothetical protein